jgi:RNA polymerase sigma-70 factor (ECF subfamily)
VTGSAAIGMPLKLVVRANMEKCAAHAEQPSVCDLTRRLAAGNEEAFRIFHAAYFDRLLRYIFVIARGDEEAAREALQETMTRVVRYARPFDSAEAFWSWLTVLARSAVVDGGRKRQRYWKLIRSYALWWEPHNSDGCKEPESESYLHQLLIDGLGILEPIERELVRKKYLDGRTTRELALEFELTERAIESRLLRARRQLREALLMRLKNDERS